MAKKDPICGMTVDEDTALRAERDAQTFSFWGDHCRRDLFFAFPCNTLGITVASGSALPAFRLASEPDDCRRRDEPEFGFGARQRRATAESEVVIRWLLGCEP